MSESTASANVAAQSKLTNAQSDEAAGRRQLPELRDALKPRYLLGWLFGFIENWFLSRGFGKLGMACPFIVAIIGGAAFVFWLRNAPQDKLVHNYETAVKTALQEDQADEAGIYLESLVRLRPNDKRYKFQLALHLIKNNQMSKGVAYLRDLTEPGRNGFNPARLWLVTQAGEQNPIIPMSPAQIESQLRLVVESEPYNPTANRLLAEQHLRSGRLKEAEDRLLNIVETVPSLGLPLAKVQRLLKRSPEQVDFHLKLAAEYFSKQLLKDPSNSEIRVARSEILMLQGKPDDAERVLNEGLALGDASVVQRSLAGLYTTIANKRLQESFLNRDLSASLLVRAITLDPAASERLQQLLALVASGASVQPADLAPGIDALQQAETRTNSEEALLCRALAAAERFDEAIVRLESLDSRDNQLQSLQARLYLLGNQQNKAEELVSNLRTSYAARHGNLSPADNIAYAEVLMLSQQFEQAMTLLKSAIADHTDSAVVGAAVNDNEAGLQQSQLDNRRLLIAYSRTCLAAYDDKLQKESFENAKQALALLDEAFETKTVPVPVLDRLAHLVSSKHNYGPDAETVLNKLLATGMGNVEIYNLLGTKALEMGDVARARTYLERAHSQSHSHPMVMNNLALALVRDDPSTANRALGLVTKVLDILPDHPDALSTRAEVLICLERWEDARRDLEIVLPKRATSRNSRMLMTRVYDALNEPTLADEHRRILKQLDEAAAVQESE